MFGITFTVIVLVSSCITGERVLDEQTEDFDFDGLPGVTHEFKISLKAGHEFCLYQKVKQGARLSISFQVLRAAGSDRLLDVIIRDPFNNFLDAINGQSEGSFDKEVSVEGIYGICLDNTAGRFASKTVYFYLGTFVMEDWDKYLKEIESISSHVKNFTTTITEVETSIATVKQQQAQSRMHVIKDWYLVTGNNEYVKWWSIFQVCIIIVTSIFQVFSLRRLFKVTVPTGARPRA